MRVRGYGYKRELEEFGLRDVVAFHFGDDEADGGRADDLRVVEAADLLCEGVCAFRSEASLCDEFAFDEFDAIANADRERVVVMPP